MKRAGIALAAALGALAGANLPGGAVQGSGQEAREGAQAPQRGDQKQNQNRNVTNLRALLNAAYSAGIGPPRVGGYRNPADMVLCVATVHGETTGNDLLSWACGRWRDEVQDRPLVNVHRRTLDDTWRQVVRYAGGNPDELLGPSHDALLARA